MFNLFEFIIRLLNYQQYLKNDEMNIILFRNNHLTLRDIDSLYSDCSAVANLNESLTYEKIQSHSACWM